ncbi:MAG: methylcobamide--CoM methyltransferase MtbA [Candidatus Lokiarchaeota archaeon]|nr:methylcobamide--CoM methyltransferase MtbA [Candidatus Lokiarchaeota archaeon]MBD3202158.1 methylcobamide--CoM methyltransferase MtbA [Candidatus Lokiarchaeota archaeon]
MPETNMNSIERVLTSMDHDEPDRVPFSLALMLHGAKLLNISMKEYFSDAENVVKAQIHLWKKYGHDILTGYFYGPIEFEAFGGGVIYFDDGPPNSGTPIIKEYEDINQLKIPEIYESERLNEVLKATRLLVTKTNKEVPILGVVISPFSLPVMQMGFGKYIELLYEQPKLFEDLMRKNQAFCIEWANAQIEAGAAAIAYYDPVSSPTIIPRELYLETGWKIAKHTLEKINAATVTHFASARTEGMIEDLIKTGTKGIGVSFHDDLKKVKEKSKGKLVVVGNLNGIDMPNWSTEQAEAYVKTTISRAARGGGFILNDNHGEIPYQVPERVLMAISDAIKKWGKYPLDWID